MSAPSNCSCPCPNPEVVTIPGAPGEAGENGTNGTNGVNAFTVLSAAVTIPAIGATVIASVGVSSWAGIGQVVFLSDGTDWGHFEVISKPSSTSIELEFLGYPGDASPTAEIGLGGTVSPSGDLPVLAAPLPTAFTDNTGGTASDTLAAGVGVSTLTIPLTSLATGLSTLAIDLLTGYVPGYAFKLLSFDFVTTVAGTGAGASQTFNLEIGSTNVTGGSLNVTLASTDTIGEVTAGTAITAANEGTAADAISIEMAAGGTVFTAGAGYFVIKIQNMDTASAVASLAEHVDDLIASLS
jgi:hypothetical protein